MKQSISKIGSVLLPPFHIIRCFGFLIDSCMDDGSMLVLRICAKIHMNVSESIR